MPEQSPEKVLLQAERWQRASFAQQKWAGPAKQAIDFLEGRQWTPEQIAEMTRQKRPALTFNIIAPLARLVLGYQRNNKSDIKFDPGQDSRASEDKAEILTRLEKNISLACELPFVDTTVFLDGLAGGRGYFDTRLDFEDNDLGEVKTKADDPFAVYPDPDCDTYDFNESASFMQRSVFISIDEIEATMGKQVAELVRPYTMGMTPNSPISSYMVNDEVTPVRFFGQREDTVTDWYDNFYGMMGDFVDVQRKTMRIIETQHKVSEQRNVMIDLETGDKTVLPETWSQERIQKALWYAEQMNNPCTVQRRRVKRIHWTTICGDVILHDAPSPYESYTQTGYFPYFRRGSTRGMIEDLIDPQKEKNKRRSSEVEIVSRLANGGWKYHENSLDPVQEQNLKRFGSTPGVNIKWKGVPGQEPEQIQPASPPMAHERLENKADEDIRRISGINESALGERDIAQSGRALEARQRQAVISVQIYMDNFAHSKKLLGRKHLEIIQQHYTEQRVYRVLGEDGKFSQVVINQMQTENGVKSILNDITVGKYSVSVDETPLSASFANAQFEEMLTLLEKMGPGMGPNLPLFMDLVMEVSSLPRKSEWVTRMKAILQAQGVPVGPDGMPMQPMGGIPMQPGGVMPPQAAAPAAV